MTDRAFWERFARSELILALEAEPQGETIRPRIFETSDGDLALAFSDAAALAAFSGGAVPYAALPGRALAAMLGPQGYGLAIDPGGDPVVLGADDLTWLARTLATAPEEGAGAIDRVAPPGEVPPALLAAIETRLAPGLFEALVLARIGVDATPLVAVIGPPEEAEAPLAAALSEALAFADAGPEWQIGFFPAEGALPQALMRHGLRLEITETARPEPAAPGSNPARPPRLR